MMGFLHLSKTGLFSRRKNQQYAHGRYLIRSFMFPDRFNGLYFQTCICLGTSKNCVRIAAIEIVLLAILIDVSNASTGHLHSISRSKRHSAPRWTIPCGPGHVAVAYSASRRTAQIEGLVIKQFETITKKAMETKQKVAHLQEMYVSTQCLQ